MKRRLLAFLLLLAAMGLSADTLDDLIAQAQSEYAKGNAAEALKTLGVASATNPTATAAKRTLSDAYTEIGVKEYDRKNYKNAYECFKNAVKLSPSNQLATKYFWKMKDEMNVDNLKNEADEAAAKAPPVKETGAAGAVTGTGGAAPTEGAGAQAGVDSAAYKETVDKLAKAEQELELLRKSSSAISAESAALKAELEKQKKEAEQQLEAINKAALAASQESASVKAELERQKLLAEQQKEELQKASLAARDQSQSLKSELDQTKVLIDQLQQRVQQSGQTAGRDAKALTDLLALYQQSLEKQGTAGQEETRVLAEQLADQRRLLEQQAQANSNRNLLLIAGFGLIALLAILFILLVVRAQVRRRRELRLREAGAPYTAMALGGEAAPQQKGRIGGGESLLLDFVPEGEKPEGQEPAAGETGMYRDLLRAERIRRMHEQMKQGTLKWETVREYIGELEKDLRVEILKIVESKILEGDGADPRAILTVLSPFLTEHDDYLREKAESLARDALAGGPRVEGRALLPSYGQEAPKETDESPLGLPKLLEITEKLKKILKDRERSAATAKVARGMARSLNLSAADSELLYKSALAHDAGYLLLDPDKLGRILGKPVLAEEDFKVIQSHTRKGIEYFKGVDVPQEFKDAILFHHERNDGSGYPKRLTGAKIPLYAKIVGVAETYVALTSARPYREKLSTEAALAVIRDGVDRKFDRELIDALADMVKRGGGSS